MQHKPKTLLLVMVMMLGVFFAPGITIADNGEVPTITRTVDPTTLYLADSGSYPDTTTVTLSVTGFGGTSEEALPLDVVFAIDSSGSMIQNDPSGLRITAAKAFIDNLDPSKDQVGVVSWDDNLDFAYGLSNDFDYIKGRIDQVDSSGGTNLNVGIQNSVNMLDTTGQTDSVKIILFLSDGSGTYTPSYAQDAADKGYIIYSIGLTISTYALQDMADRTGGTFYSSPDASNLQAIFNEIYTTIIISTSMANVDLIEVTQPYIIDESDFSIAPDVMTEIDGKTMMVWYNISQYVGNLDGWLAADETFVVSYTARSSTAGHDLPVSVYGEALVSYLDPDDTAQLAMIPQGYIDVWVPIMIDIKPGSYPNSINLKSNGRLPVAILTTDTFDATTIDPDTVLFEGASPVHWAYEDVDHDGDIDLILHFHLKDTGLTATSMYGYLTAETFDGMPVVGVDTVRIVPPK